MSKEQLLQEENQKLKEEIADLEKKVKQMEEIAKTSYDKELEQFTYVATHDLKSPLANMQGFIDLLEMDLDGHSEEVTKSLKWLKYSVEEARRVIEDLTKAIRARNNTTESLTLINLDTLTESILSGMRSTILGEQIVIITDFSEVSEVEYYPVAMRSILQNLISNACSYKDLEKEVHEIKITALENEKYITIEIADNGIGIDLSENVEKVFGLFKRVTVSGEGSGIGMYIVQQLLNNYGGKISVDSELGRGTSFTIYLPKKIEIK